MSSIAIYYHELREKTLREEINSLEKDYIFGADPTELADYLFGRYALSTIEIDSSRKIEGEPVTVKERVRDSFGDVVEREVTRVRLIFPIVVKDHIETTLELRASQQYLRDFGFEYDPQEGRIVVVCEAREVGTIKEEVKQTFEWKNTDVNQQNGTLKQFIIDLINERKSKLEETDKNFEKFMAEAGIPVRLKEKENDPSITVEVKRELVNLVKPKAEIKKEPTLREKDLLAVIRLISSTARSFEDTPKTFSKLGETDLRDVILSGLNGVFEGEATGETFSKLGKTDIRLNIKDGNILIAECKLWTGPSKLADAIDQLFRYLNLRQNFGIIIFFCKARGFTSLVEIAKQTTAEHPTFNPGLREISETHFSSSNTFPEDSRKRVDIHYIFFNLYAGEE